MGARPERVLCNILSQVLACTPLKHSGCQSLDHLLCETHTSALFSFDIIISSFEV